MILSDNGLPGRLYRAAEVRKLDHQAIEVHGIPGLTLMERAGESSFRLLRALWPRWRRIWIFCGSGNNAGDGYVLARLAHQAGLAVRVISITDPEKLKGEAVHAAKDCRAAGVSMIGFSGDAPPERTVIVDALLGIGLERMIGGAYRDAIRIMNTSRAPVFAIDIPSGLDADRGAAMGEIVHATATLSFIGLKLGAVTGIGPSCCGALYFDDLEVPDDVYNEVPPSAERLHAAGSARLLPNRLAHAHKGDFGHVAIVGGNLGMPGAAVLAGTAAYRVGVGLVSVCTHPAYAGLIPLSRPELMCQAVEEAARVSLSTYDVVAIGPGLGQDKWAQALFARTVEFPGPLVVDADGLSLLAQEPLRRDNWILTPHPGEAARLLGSTPEAIQEDRLQAAAAIASRYGGVCVLKGAGTVVASQEGMAVCTDGNPGMATGGMGDVLSGMLAGWIAQGLTTYDSARLSVWLHARTGDAVSADRGEQGLMAGDIVEALPREIMALQGRYASV